MDRGAWWATVHGVSKSRTRLSTAQHWWKWAPRPPLALVTCCVHQAESSCPRHKEVRVLAGKCREGASASLCPRVMSRVLQLRGRCVLFRPLMLAVVLLHKRHVLDTSLLSNAFSPPHCTPRFQVPGACWRVPVFPPVPAIVPGGILCGPRGRGLQWRERNLCFYSQSPTLHQAVCVC